MSTKIKCIECGANIDYQIIVEYVRDTRQNDVDELIEWAEGEEKFTPPDRSKSPMFTYKDVTAPYNRGYNSALSDIITHLKSIKEKI